MASLRSPSTIIRGPSKHQRRVSSHLLQSRAEYRSHRILPITQPDSSIPPMKKTSRVRSLAAAGATPRRLVPNAASDGYRRVERFRIRHGARLPLVMVMFPRVPSPVWRPTGVIGTLGPPNVGKDKAFKGG